MQVEDFLKEKDSLAVVWCWVPGTVLGTGIAKSERDSAIPTFGKLGGSCNPAAEGRKYRESSEHRRDI